MQFFWFSLPTTLTALSVVATLLCAANGCSRSATNETPSTPKAGSSPKTDKEPTFEDFVEMELAQIRTQAGLPPFREDNGDLSGPVWQNLDELLLEIERLDNIRDQDHRYSDMARQLILENRLDDAAKVTGRIREEKLRDTLSEDIVRFRMQAAIQLSRTTRSRELIPPEISDLIRRATETSRNIGDPLLRAESLGNIALFRWKLKDRAGAVDMIREAGDSLRRLEGDDLRKARGLHYLARWLLRQGDNEGTYEYCKESEAVAVKLRDPLDAATLLLDLSSIFTLLNKDEDARKTCDAAAGFVERIEQPKEKATSLLKLAEAALIARMKEKTGSPAKKLLSVKKLVLDAAEIVAKRPDPESLSTSSEEQAFSSVERSPADSPDHPVRAIVLDWDELTDRKNEILCRIAKMQVWGAPLEDVWDTVLDIDEGPRRDEALVAAVEMLLASEAWEDAEAWVEEIVEPAKKREWSEKVKTAKDPP